LRRKCAAFRRRANTYAKSISGLQRMLDVYWVIHHFIRIHSAFRTWIRRPLDGDEKFGLPKASQIS